jgi:hypothetical protein
VSLPEPVVAVSGVKPPTRYEIVKRIEEDGNVRYLGLRHFTQANTYDYYQALETPGLCLRAPDGSVEEGKQ